MIDTHDLKAQVDIVDVIAGYVALRKNGKNHTGLCPFHNEKTPSFTVEQDKQLFHCFGCGQSGDVIDFLKEYNGWDFRQAAKELGADIEALPVEKIRRNEQRVMHRYRLPPDHKQDPELAQMGTDSGALDRRHLDIRTASGELVNLYSIDLGLMLAGGYSYNGAHWIIKNDKPNAVAVQSYELGCAIASKYNLNVAVCFSGAVMKYMCLWNSGKYKLKPAISSACDDFLAYEMPWLSWDGNKLKKENVK